MLFPIIERFPLGRKNHRMLLFPKASNGWDRIQVAIKLYEAVEELVHHRVGIDIGSVGRIERDRLVRERAPIHTAKAGRGVFGRRSYRHTAEGYEWS